MSACPCPCHSGGSFASDKIPNHWAVGHTTIHCPCIGGTREDLKKILLPLLKANGELKFLAAVGDVIAEAGTYDWARTIRDMCEIMREQGAKEEA